MSSANPKPTVSPAAQMIREMAASLQSADEVPREAYQLVDAVRDLVEAVLMTDVAASERGAVADDVAALTRRLETAQRPNPVWLVRVGKESYEHMTQAGTGPLNPQALPLEWLTPDGETSVVPVAHPETGEVVARCTLRASHVGPPGRAHGGVVATLLDQVVGMASAAVDRPGMTAGLDIRYRGATPYGAPLEVRARYTHTEGRKHFATGEIVADGVVTASALGVFIGHPEWSESQ